MAKRASPGIGHNLPDPADFRKALAVEILDQEEAKRLREKRKTNRAAAEGKNVNLSDLDAAYQHRDDTLEEIIHFIKRRLHGFAAIWTDLGEQFHILEPKAEAPEVRGAVYHAGMMAGVTGKPNIPPPGLVGDKLQKWQHGFNEGATARDEAEKEKLAIWAQAIENAKAGKATDGKTGEAIEPKPKAAGRDPKAKAVGDKAAEDFAKDNPGVQTAGGQAAKTAPDQPDWKDFSDDPEDWFGGQNRDFQAWYDEVPLSVVPEIVHPGAKAKFDELRSAEPIPEQPDWAALGFPDDNTAWTVPQKDDFCRWFDSIPAGSSAPFIISHAGAQAEFKHLRDAEQPVAKPAADPTPAPAPKAKPESQSEKASRLAAEAAAGAKGRAKPN